jgi:Tol biopolymer transport system component/beta-lactamase regulating signal transducer with metallopeptidase domain
LGLLAYLLGIGLLFCLIGAQRLRIGRWLRQGRILTEPRVVEAFKAAQRRLGLARGCAVVEIEAVEAPMTIRTFYPVVALPKGFTSELSESELLMLAMHELAHIKRSDPLLLSLTSLIRAVLFFHPLVWLAAREVSILGEEAADDAVLDATDEPLPYAKMLTRLTEGLTRRMFATELAVGIVFSKSGLLRRIEAILSDRSEQLRRLSGLTLAMTLAVAFGSLFLAVAVPLTSQDSTKPRHAAGMVQRHLWDVMPMSDLTGRISPDGRFLSYDDWTAGNVAARDLATDTSWLVTKNTSWETLNGWSNNSVISPDGKRIAYAWYNEKGVDFYDLRIIDRDGSNMRVLYHDASIFYINPYDWSPDGKDILAYFCEAERTLVDAETGARFRKAYLVLVSVADGSVRILKTWEKRRWPMRAAFSPDGRYVAYDFGLNDFDILMIDLEGGDETTLIEHPADDRLCGWAPDGQQVVFASDRSAMRGLWTIEVADGLAQGSARALLGQFEGKPIGFTEDGSFYYGISTTASNVYHARLDPTDLDFEGEFELASSQFVGSTTIGDWSSDGSFLAYRGGRDGERSSSAGFGDWIFAVYSAENSQERIISPSPAFVPGSRMSGPQVSPDGQSLLVCGHGQEGGHGLYTIDVETGTVKLIVRGRTRHVSPAVWSPDGKFIYVRWHTSVSRLDPESGQETDLCQVTGYGGLDVSPDGRWLAFYEGQRSLMLVSSGGGEPREVVRLEAQEQSYPPFVSWTPDGDHLLFGKRRTELWKVNVETGEQQQIGPAIEYLAHATMHPDGRQIALTVEQPGSELWVMENLLPDRKERITARNF